MAILAGCVRDAAGTVVRWSPSFQVLPLSPNVTRYLHTPAYAHRVEHSLATHRFEVDHMHLANGSIGGANVCEMGPHVDSPE